MHYRYSKFVYMVLVLVFYFLAMCSLERHFLNTSISKVSYSILHSKRQKYLKSVKSVSILLVVMIIFSSPLLVRNVLGIVQPLPKVILSLVFILANINSFLNPMIYFIDIVEFKTALKRLFSMTQSSDDSSAGDTMQIWTRYESLGYLANHIGYFHSFL